MNILITNDDGIGSVGLHTLVEEFKDCGDVYVVAPDGERSSNSHHLTIMGRVKVEEREMADVRKAYAVYGTPADCTYLALDYLLKDVKFDLLVSGINKGGNLSTDIIYSGTVAAARQAYLLGVPAAAISVNSFKATHYEPAAHYCKQIALKYLKQPDCLDYFLNINVPDLPLEEIKGIKVCERKAHITYDNNLDDITENGEFFVRVNSLTVHVEADMNDLGIDVIAVNNGYVSVSPLHDDHIEHNQIARLEDYLL